MVSAAMTRSSSEAGRGAGAAGLGDGSWPYSGRASRSERVDDRNLKSGLNLQARKTIPRLVRVSPGLNRSVLTDLDEQDSDVIGAAGSLCGFDKVVALLGQTFLRFERVAQHFFGQDAV